MSPCGNPNRSKFLESSDEEDGSGRDAAADDNDNYSEKRGGNSRDLHT